MDCLVIRKQFLQNWSPRKHGKLNDNLILWHLAAMILLKLTISNWDDWNPEFVIGLKVVQTSCKCSAPYFVGHEKKKPLSKAKQLKAGLMWSIFSSSTGKKLIVFAFWLGFHKGSKLSLPNIYRQFSIHRKGCFRFVNSTNICIRGAFFKNHQPLPSSELLLVWSFSNM